MHLPPYFVEAVHRVFGDDGRAWLPRLPGILEQCRDKWGLSQGSPCPDMRMNYIEFTSTAGGCAVALKVGVPHDELFSEMDALRLYDGRGAVRLLDADRELGAMLMQRVQPGTMLWELGDNCRETRIAASIMRRLPVPAPAEHPFPRFSHWVERAFRLTRGEWDPEERMPRDLIDSAERAFRAIEGEGGEDVVLHGDLHHENILLDERAGWVAVDPKGAIGPRCLEMGRFLQNQLPEDEPLERIEGMVRARLETFSGELGYSWRTMVACGLVDCILSMCWCFEEEGGPGPYWPRSIEVARMLQRLLEG